MEIGVWEMRGEADKVRVIDFSNRVHERVDEKLAGPNRVRHTGRLASLNLTAADLNEAEDPLDNLLRNVMYDCSPGNLIRRK